MPIFNNIVCVSGDRLIKSDANPMGVMSLSMYTNLVSTKKINRLRRAAPETPALIEFDSLPMKYRDAYTMEFGDPKKEVEKSYAIMDQVIVDNKAAKFYATYKLASGDDLPPQVQLQYT